MSETTPNPYRDDPDFEAQGLPGRQYESRREEAARRRAVVKRMAKRYENRATIPHSDRFDEAEREEDSLAEALLGKNPIKVIQPDPYDEDRVQHADESQDTRRPAVRRPGIKLKKPKVLKKEETQPQTAAARQAPRAQSDAVPQQQNPRPQAVDAQAEDRPQVASAQAEDRPQDVGAQTVAHPQGADAPIDSRPRTSAEARTFVAKTRALPRRTLGIAAAVCVVAIVAIVMVVRTSAFNKLVQSTGSDAAEAATGLSTFVDQVEGNDLAGAEQTASQIDTHITALEQSVSSGGWRGGSGDAAKAVAKQLRATYDALVTPVLAVGKEQGSFDIIGTDDRVDTDLAVALTDALAAADPTVDDLESSIADLADASTDEFGDVAEQTKKPLAHIKSATSHAATLQPGLAGLLGVDGPRSYLVVVQDPAQWRSTGGYPRSMGVLTVDDGAFSLDELDATDTTFSFLYYGTRIEGTEEETGLFGDAFTKHMGTLLYLPDVPRAAQAVTTSFENVTGTTVAGAIFVDPVAFEGMLGLAGTVSLEDGTVVDKANVVSYLENELAANMDSWDMGEYFTSTSAGIIDQFLDKLGDYDLADLTDFARKQAQAGHLIAWAEDATEEEVFAGLDADGTISRDSADPELGVFLNDASDGSIDWYLTATTDLGEPSTADDGAVTYTVTTTIENALTEEQAQNIRNNSWSTSALGTSYNKYEASDAIVDVYFFAPAGGSIADLTCASSAGSADWEPREGSWEGLAVTAGTVHVVGGDTVTFSYKVTCAADSAPLALRQTPNAQAAD